MVRYIGTPTSTTYARAMGGVEAPIAAEPESAGLKLELELGTLALVEGDFQTAEASLRAARKLAPREARIALRLADVLVETGRIEEGAEACREASALAGEISQVLPRGLRGGVRGDPPAERAREGRESSQREILSGEGGGAASARHEGAGASTTRAPGRGAAESRITID